MPTPPRDEDFTKVTLNLYASDVAWLKRYFGQGWSTAVRAIIRKRIVLLEGLKKESACLPTSTE